MFSQELRDALRADNPQDGSIQIDYRHVTVAADRHHRQCGGSRVGLVNINGIGAHHVANGPILRRLELEGDFIQNVAVAEDSDEFPVFFNK